MCPLIIHKVSIAAAVGLFPAIVLAQTTSSTANFTGMWKMDESRSELAAQDQPVGEFTIAITQTGSVLKVETTRDGKKDTAMYPFVAHPTATTNEWNGTPRAYWEGAALVDEGSLDIDGQSVGFREARTSSPDGSEMVVETTLKIQHGYELKGGQTIVSGKNVFVRRH